MDELTQAIYDIASQSVDSNPTIVDSKYPNQSLDQITSVVLAQVKTAFQAEIANDPTQRGYADQTDAQIAILLNSAYQTQSSQNTYDESGNITGTIQVTQDHVSRVGVIFNGIPFTPNLFTAGMVTVAK